MFVVFDTNVLIPLVLDASLSTRLFRRLEAADHHVVASPAILDEVNSKLRTKASLRRWLGLPDESIEAFIGVLPAQLVIVPGNIEIEGAVPRDATDDKLIAAAIEGSAAYIVTEDQDLLSLGAWQGIRIVNRPTFEVELDALGVPRLEGQVGR